jgi:hypothetical protein
MSSPGFLLSNDSNHDLLQSLLESMNAIIEHQFISKFQILVAPSSHFLACYRSRSRPYYIAYLSEELRLSHYSLIEINMTAQGFQSRSKLAEWFSADYTRR